MVDYRQQQFVARLANPCCRKLKELHQNLSSGAPICKVVWKQHEHGRTTDDINWPAPGEESVVMTTILDDATPAKRAAQLSTMEKEAKV
jgi:hypothetical protein